MKEITLNNGAKMPKLGYGVYQVDPADAKHCVSDAIDVSHRFIDTLFQPNQFIDLASSEEVVPSVKQIESYVFCQQIKVKNVQMAFCYLIQRGVIIILKSTYKERMKENLNLFDLVSLTGGDILSNKQKICKR